MQYYNSIQDCWNNFDKFLDYIKPKVTKKQYFYAYSIRNVYVAFTELNYGKASTMRDIKNFCRIVINICKMIAKKYCLENKSEIIILEISTKEDTELSKKIGFPLAKIKSSFKLGYNFNLKREALLDCFKILNLLRKDRYLLKCNILYCFSQMVMGAHIYIDINLCGVKKIITQRDRYPEEQAVIQRAKEENIYTIKIDNFPVMGRYTQNTIFCDNYYCPNKISNFFFKQYEQNDLVNFIDGGFVFWDYLRGYEYQPQSKPRIITFFTQYGHDLGIFGDKGPDFYIEEIIECLEPDMHLFIKIHPLEKGHVYKKYQSEKVHIINHGDIDSWELVGRSAFCFAVTSSAILQAKNICPNSCYINYYPDKVLDCEYERLEGTISLITSKDMLKATISGLRETALQKDFIQVFNPLYPNSSEDLYNVVMRS